MSWKDTSWGTALKWMPTFLGFPAGGLAAKLIVGHIDAVTPALVGGGISGAFLGLAQWLGFGGTGPDAAPWIGATAVGMAAGLTIGSAVVDYGYATGALATQGAICGAIVGLAQAPFLLQRLGKLALAWPAFLSGLWALGWTITAAAGIDVEAQYTVFGSSGAIVVTAATSAVAVALRRSAEGSVAR